MANGVTSMTDPFESLRQVDQPVEPPEELRLRVRVLLQDLEARARDGQFDHDEPLGASKISYLDEEPTMITVELSRARKLKRAKRIGAGAVVAAAALIIALVIVFRSSDDDVKVVGTPTTSPAPPTTAGSTPGVELPPVKDANELGATSWPVGLFTGDVKVVDGVVWLSNEDGPIERFDARTGASLGKIDVTNKQGAMHPAVAFGSMWIGQRRDDTVYRVDLSTGAVQAAVKVPAAIPSSGGPVYAPVAATDNAVYVVGLTDGSSKGQLFRIDPSTNQVVGSFAVPLLTSNVEWGFGSLWLTTDKAVVRVDPVTGAQLASIPLDQNNLKYLLGIRAVAGGIWLHGRNGPSADVVRIDPTTNTVVAQFSTGNEPDGSYLRTDFVSAGGSIWTCANDAALVRIDPATNKVVSRFVDQPTGGCYLTADGNAIWFGAFSGKTLYRFQVP